MGRVHSAFRHCHVLVLWRVKLLLCWFPHLQNGDYDGTCLPGRRDKWGRPTSDEHSAQSSVNRTLHQTQNRPALSIRILLACQNTGVTNSTITPTDRISGALPELIRFACKSLTDAGTNTAFLLNMLVIWWGGQLSEITSPGIGIPVLWECKGLHSGLAPPEEMRRARCIGPASAGECWQTEWAVLLRPLTRSGEKKGERKWEGPARWPRPQREKPWMGEGFVSHVISFPWISFVTFFSQELFFR